MLTPDEEARLAYANRVIGLLSQSLGVPLPVVTEAQFQEGLNDLPQLAEWTAQQAAQAEKGSTEAV